MKNKKYAPFIGFCSVITLFYLIFTRLIIKTDDGHFLGIMSEEGFSLAEWLRLRYETISGRTVCELLTMSFLGTNIVVWKLFAAFMWIAIVYFIVKLMSSFDKEGTYNFVLCIPFLVFIGCLNPAAFWFSGSLTYLFPFGCMVITLAPIIFDLMEIKYKRIVCLVLSFTAAFTACSQEQSAALTLGFYSVSLIAAVFKKKFRFYHCISALPCAFQTYILFSAPGMSERMRDEASGFERFTSMGILEKMLCGLSNYYAFGFLMSVIVFGIFISVLILKLRSLYSSRLMPILLSVFFALSVVGGNALSYIADGAIPDKAFEKMFISGRFSTSGAIIIVLCTLTLLLIAASLVMIAAKEKRAGICSLNCYLAGVCSAVVLGFSSSVYASGQRVFFFSEMLTLISCAILLASMKNDRRRKTIENTSVIVALCVLLINCLSWFFMEIPIMG